jgi:acyl-CoA-binding protein
VPVELKLKFYALYKQAMNEDISYSRPSLFHPVAVKKWNAWHQLLGMSKEEAMLRYIRTLTSIDPDWEQHPALDNYSMDYPMT